MAAPESQAVNTNQGNAKVCTCFALAMAATEGGCLENAQSKFLLLSVDTNLKENTCT